MREKRYFPVNSLAMSVIFRTFASRFKIIALQERAAPLHGARLSASGSPCPYSGFQDHSESSAVGSVPRSGRGGREFESPLSDTFIEH